MAINSDKRVIHRFIREISAYEFGGELYSQIIPVDTQAYAIYPNEEGNRFFYVIGDGEHTYTEIRDGKGIGEACKEYPVFTKENLNIIVGGIEEETRERKAADELLQLQIDNEKLTREQIDNYLQQQIDNNDESISEIQRNLTKEVFERKEAVEEERVARTNSDESLIVELYKEVEERKHFDELLDEALGEEIQNREAAITNLFNELKSDIDNHASDKENPHQVTKAQIGLGNVDNTSDLDKPISIATQNALDEISVLLSDEETRATSKENELESAITSEVLRATQAEELLSDTKLDKISDVNKLYGTDSQGNQIGYNLDTFGKIDDVRVGGTSVVTNKIANLGTMASETASNYSTKAVADTLYADKIETEQALAGKQNNLTQPQLDAVNSGITSNLVGQITTNQINIGYIEEKIPAQASSENKLADKEFVNSSIATNTARFIGTFANISQLKEYSDPITNNDYAFVINSLITNDNSDWETFNALDEYNKDLLTNFDYAWVINGSNFDLYRFNIIEQEWDLRAFDIKKESVTLNTAYNRYKANVEDNVVTWEFEYTLNNSSFTANQWASINSGATSEKIEQIATNVEAINTINSSAVMTSGITSTKVSNYDTHISDTVIHVTSSDKQTWNAKQNALTAGSNIQIDGDVISATDTTYTAGTGIDITNGVISNTQTSAEWGNITGTLSDQTDLQNALDEKQDVISDLSDIRSGASAGATAVQASDLGDVAFSNDYNDLDNLPTIPVIPTNVSAFINDAGYLTEHQDISGKQDVITSENKLSADLIEDGTTNKTVTESEKSTWSGKQDVISDLSTIRTNATAGKSAADTISSYGDIVTHDADEFLTDADLTDYAKKSEIPTVNNSTITIQKNGTEVDSFTINQVGDKSINITVPTTAQDVGALPDTTVIPVVQDLYSPTTSNGMSGIAVASAISGKANTSDLATVATTGDYNDLSNLPEIPSAQIQSDWNQTDDRALDYIKNKPYIPSEVIVDQTYDSDSTHAQSGTAVAQAISGKQDVLTSGSNITIENGVISATDTTYTAGVGINIENGVISNTHTSAEWGNIIGTLNDQIDLQTALNDKADKTTTYTKTEVDANLENKLDKISTTNSVYGTNEHGEQVSYSVDSFGAVDDVQVNGTSIVSNKIANFIVDDAPIQSSTNLITSGGVYSAIPSIIMRDWSSNNNSNL